MGVASIIKYEGPSNALVWKSSVTDFNVGSQLIVPESQEAVFFKDGQALDSFGSGRHELLTNNLPFLRKIYEKLTNTSSVFQAEVYYVNKTISEELLWGTNSPIQLEDPKYGILINLRSFGSFKIQVNNPRNFLIKTVGNIKQFNKEEIQNYFRNEMISKIKVELAKAITISNISVLQIAVYQEELAKLVKQTLSPILNEYGLDLKQFIISSIKASEEDLKKLRQIKEERAKTIIDADARKQAMDILGTNYKEMETFDVMKEAAKNQADGGLVGLGVGLGLGPTISKTMTDNLSNQSLNQQEEVINCPHCKALIKQNSKFCSECGERVSSSIICCDCKTENTIGTKFCRECGKKL